MHHRSAKHSHALQRRRQILDREVGQRERVAGTAPTRVYANVSRLAVGLPSVAFSVMARIYPDAEDAGPEAQGALRIVGGKLDQRGSDGNHQRRANLSRAQTQVRRSPL